MLTGGRGAATDSTRWVRYARSLASMEEDVWSGIHRGFHLLEPVQTANRMHFFPKNEPHDPKSRIAGATGATPMRQDVK
jgi:hypothetical protein